MFGEVQMGRWVLWNFRVTGSELGVLLGQSRLLGFFGLFIIVNFFVFQRVLGGSKDDFICFLLQLEWKKIEQRGFLFCLNFVKEKEIVVLGLKGGGAMFGCFSFFLQFRVEYVVQLVIVIVLVFFDQFFQGFLIRVRLVKLYAGRNLEFIVFINFW